MESNTKKTPRCFAWQASAPVDVAAVSSKTAPAFLGESVTWLSSDTREVLWFFIIYLVSPHL